MRLQGFVMAAVVLVIRGTEDRNQKRGLGLSDNLSQTGEKVFRHTYSKSVAIEKCN